MQSVATSCDKFLLNLAQQSDLAVTVEVVLDILLAEVEVRLAYAVIMVVALD